MVYMFLGTGFEETEAIAPLDLLRRAGIPVQTVGVNGKLVYGGHGIGVEADLLLEEKLAVEQISALVGYSSASYFSSAFKQKYGLSPKQYQNRKR